MYQPETGVEEGVPLDFIGDIHGEDEKLEAVLARLGYRSRSGSFRHSEGRKVVFLGDFIDRGPGIERVLTRIRSMIEEGQAHAVLGNHEFSAITWHTRDPDSGDWLRSHSPRHEQSYRETLAAFSGREAELERWIAWMRTLPYALDFGGARAVHACWDAKGLALLGNRSLEDDGFLRLAADRSTPEGSALHRILGGARIPLPEGWSVAPSPGVSFRTISVKWWLSFAPGRRYPDVAIKDYGTPLPDEPVPDTAEVTAAFPGYPADASPCFFGHYWFPPHGVAPGPVTPNLACLDYSAAEGGPLVAYRWEGEEQLAADRMVAVNLECVKGAC